MRDMHGGSLDGVFSAPLVNYLRYALFKTGEVVKPMIDAMMETWGTIWDGMRKFENHYFQANIHSPNGWLNVSCPGDACGLHPSDSSDRWRGGYRFSCHNTDNPAQQLTLLAGLAALCHETNEWLNQPRL